jgi:hypothetical protein
VYQNFSPDARNQIGDLMNQGFVLRNMTFGPYPSSPVKTISRAPMVCFWRAALSKVLASAAAALAIVVTGCTPVTTIVNNAPAAQTPSLLAVSHPGSPPVSVSPEMGRFDVMPDNAVIIDFQAPWPSSVTVSLDGQNLDGTNDRSVMSSLQAQGKGYYMPIQTAPVGSTFDWTISVAPPPALATGTGFHISIVNTSMNPNLTGSQKTSAPLDIPIGSALYSRVAATPLKPSAAFCGNIPISAGDPCGPNQFVPAGKVTPNVEIRGWVVNAPGPGDPFNNDQRNPPEEFTYSVLLDWGWTPDPVVVAAGIKPITSLSDIDSAITPHNVIRFGVDSTKMGEEQSHEAQLTSDALVWGGPGGMVVHVENDSWYNGGAAGNVGRKAGIPVPTGWVPAPTLDGRVSWSFDPSHPLAWPTGQPITRRITT